jgi:hypothetical protein
MVPSSSVSFWIFRMLSKAFFRELKIIEEKLLLL